MRAEWLTLNEMEEAISRVQYRDIHGYVILVDRYVAKQIAKAVADASKAKADSLA